MCRNFDITNRFHFQAYAFICTHTIASAILVYRIAKMKTKWFLFVRLKSRSSISNWWAFFAWDHNKYVRWCNAPSRICSVFAQSVETANIVCLQLEKAKCPSTWEGGGGEGSNALSHLEQIEYNVLFNFSFIIAFSLFFTRLVIRIRFHCRAQSNKYIDVK